MIEDVKQLAKGFVDSTLNKWGTEESQVDQILKTVHDSKAQTEFEAAVASTLNEEQAKLFVKKLGGRGPVDSILRYEMKGSELARALDLYRHGSETHRASYGEYFVEGLKDSVDLSSTESKVAVGVGGAVLAGLAVLSAPAALVVGGVVLVGTAIYGIGKSAKSAWEMAHAKTEAEAKEKMRDLGEGIGITAMSAPFAPKGALAAKGAVSAMRAGRAEKAVAAAAEAAAQPEAAATAEAASSVAKTAEAAPKPQQAEAATEAATVKALRTRAFEGDQDALSALIKLAKSGDTRATNYLWYTTMRFLDTPGQEAKALLLIDELKLIAKGGTGESQEQAVRALSELYVRYPEFTVATLEWMVQESAVNPKLYKSWMKHFIIGDPFKLENHMKAALRNIDFSPLFDKRAADTMILDVAHVFDNAAVRQFHESVSHRINGVRIMEIYQLPD